MQVYKMIRGLLAPFFMNICFQLSDDRLYRVHSNNRYCDRSKQSQKRIDCVVSLTSDILRVISRTSY